MRMKEREKIRNHNRRGFTLAETLLALLILMMVSTIVATGIPVAKNAYEKVVLASNAEVLLSTTLSALRNELGTAGDIVILDGSGNEVVGKAVAAGSRLKKYEGKGLTYLNSTRGSLSKIYLGKTTNKNKDVIFLQRYAGTPAAGEGNIGRLISAETSTDDLYVVYTDVSYDDSTDLITFSGLSVNRESGAEKLAGRDSFSIRIIK